MKRLTRTGYVIAGATATAVLVGGGAAFAYWTTTGSGTATASAGTTDTVDIDQDGSITGLYPGGSSPIAATITNPNPGAVTIGAVTVAVVSTSNEALCPAADNFTITGNAWDGGVIAGAGTQAANGATINMLNTASDQNACKNVTVNLSFTAN